MEEECEGVPLMARNIADMWRRGTGDSTATCVSKCGIMWCMMATYPVGHLCVWSRRCLQPENLPKECVHLLGRNPTSPRGSRNEEGISPYPSTEPEWLVCAGPPSPPGQ